MPELDDIYTIMELLCVKVLNLEFGLLLDGMQLDFIRVTVYSRVIRPICAFSTISVVVPIYCGTFIDW